MNGYRVDEVVFETAANISWVIQEFDAERQTWMDRDEFHPWKSEAAAQLVLENWDWSTADYRIVKRKVVGY